MQPKRGMVRPISIFLVAVLILTVGAGAAHVHFNRQSAAAVRSLFAGQAAFAPETVTAGEVAAQPVPVRRWLEGAGVVGGPRPHRVRVHQRGRLRLGPDGAWLPAEAVQVFRTDEPGFVWTVKVMMMRFLPVLGRDSYVGGHGRMLITGAGLVPLVDAAGPEIDQGTLLRYLGELVWFPAAALAPYIRWEAQGGQAARATINRSGSTVSATFSFAADGRVLALEAQRYREVKGRPVLTPWRVTMTAWAERGGALIPTTGTVAWLAPEGAFDCYRWEISKVDVNERGEP